VLEVLEFYMNEQRASALQKKADEFALPVPKDPGVDGAAEVRRRPGSSNALGLRRY